jgi:hypothetical protein
MGKGGGGGTKTVETSSRPIPELEQFAFDNLQIASDIANQPYIPTPQGMNRIAEFDPLEQQSFQNVANTQGLIGQPMGGGVGQDFANWSGQQAGAQTGIANASTAGAYNQGIQGQMGGYMNPFTQSVIGGVESDLRDARDRTVRGIEDNLDASSFGGTRAAVAADLADQTYMDSLAQASGQLRSAGFNTALGAAQAGAAGASTDRSRATQAAQQFGQLGLQGAEQMRRSGLSRLDRDLGVAEAQQGAGALNRSRDQAQLSQNYGDYLDELNNPLRGLQIRSQQLGLTPVGSIGRVPVVEQGGGMGSALGGLGGLLSGFASLGGCWVAREVYGLGDPKWLHFREWLLERAPAWLRRLYLARGADFALWLHGKPRVQRVLRRIMDRIVASDQERKNAV